MRSLPWVVLGILLASPSVSYAARIGDPDTEYLFIDPKSDAGLVFWHYTGLHTPFTGPDQQTQLFFDSPYHLSALVHPVSGELLTAMTADVGPAQFGSVASYTMLNSTNDYGAQVEWTLENWQIPFDEDGLTPHPLDTRVQVTWFHRDPHAPASIPFEDLSKYYQELVTAEDAHTLAGYRTQDALFAARHSGSAPETVPEPMSVMLFGMGLLGLLGMSQRKRQRVG